ncbi:MAG TPA: hypothetical protein PLR75_00940 [Candidatus Pacearchaeota archaeon]|nr:hypothetical protein [Candidatus Pacearchaeota archaeon]
MASNYYKYFKNFFICCLLFFGGFCSIDSAQANYGWQVKVEAGNSSACGSNGALIRVLALKGTTENIASSNITLNIRRQSDNKIVRSVSGTGTTSYICLDVYNESVETIVDETSSYHDFYTSYYPTSPAQSVGAKWDSHVHLTPISQGMAYFSAFPNNVWVNYDPQFTVQLASMPGVHSATSLSVIMMADSFNGNKKYSTVNVSGGVGKYNLPKLGLSDGWHQWFFKLGFNNQPNPLYSGVAPWVGYGIDRAKPTASVSHSPASPDSTSTVTITANAQDALSGLDTVSIYVDGSVKKTCNFSGAVSAQTCQYAGGPYAANSSHNYYAVATDLAGNKTTTSTKSFNVTAPACACTPWANGACAGGSCTTLQRQQTRTCNPVACDAQSQCVADATCCVCTAWADDDCGLGTCGANQMRQTRTCNPAACDVESQCAASASCPRTLTLSLTANPNTGNAPLATTITGTVGGTAVGTINYTTWWDCDDPCSTVSACQAACGAWDDKADGQAAAVRALNHTYSAAGTFHPKMIVERHNLSASGSVAVTVINGPPSVSALVNQTDYCGSGLSTMFSWTYSDPENDPQAFRQVQVDDNSNFSSAVDDTGKAAASSTSYTVLSSKLAYNTTYYWRIKVWDSAGNNSGWVNGPSFTTPLHGYPAIDFSWTPSTPKATELITYTDLTQVFGGSTIVSRSWEIEGANPNTSAAESPAVTYAAKGDYATKLTVTDSNGYTCSLEKNITVKKSIPDWEEG